MSLGRINSVSTYDSYPGNHPGNFKVFLGGACGPTVWRKKTAIPFLSAHNIEYYNPQVDNWYPELINIEEAEKESADALLFVIGATSGIASMIEAMEHIVCSPQRLVLVLEDWMPEDATDPKYLNDVNRGRKYLRSAAKKNDIVMYDSLNAALNTVVSMRDFRRERLTTF